MAKAKNGRAAGGKAKTEAKTRAKPKSEKKTVEQLTDMERQKLLFQYKNKLAPLLEEEKEAKAAVTKMFEEAKKIGIPKADIKIALALDDKLHDPEEHDKNVEKQKQDVERVFRISRWMQIDIGAQLEMFVGSKETKSERLFEAGRIVALNDQPARLPSHMAPESKDAKTWLEGYAGRTELNTQRASGFRTLAEVAKAAGVDASIGDQPPTYRETETEPEPAHH